MGHPQFLAHSEEEQPQILRLPLVAQDDKPQVNPQPQLNAQDDGFVGDLKWLDRAGSRAR